MHQCVRLGAGQGLPLPAATLRSGGGGGRCPEQGHTNAKGRVRYVPGASRVPLLRAPASACQGLGAADNQVPRAERQRPAKVLGRRAPPPSASSPHRRSRERERQREAASLGAGRCRAARPTIRNHHWGRACVCMCACVCVRVYVCMYVCVCPFAVRGHARVGWEGDGALW